MMKVKLQNFVSFEDRVLVAKLDGKFAAVPLTELHAKLRGSDGKDGAHGRDGRDGRDILVSPGKMTVEDLVHLKGEPGTNGVDGTNGTNGFNGKDGQDGKDGLNGLNGTDGVDGKDGFHGKDGRNGIDGKDGRDGKDGFNGADGANFEFPAAEEGQFWGYTGGKWQPAYPPGGGGGGKGYRMRFNSIESRITALESSGGISANQKLDQIVFHFNGGGQNIEAGLQCEVSCEYACTIVSHKILGDASGSAVVDLWKDTYANYPPTVLDTIVASAKPTLSGANKNQDTTLTGWTLAIAAGDIIKANLDSVSGLKRVTLILKVSKT